MSTTTDKAADLLRVVASRGWIPGSLMTCDFVTTLRQYEKIIEAGFYSKSLPLAAVAVEIANHRKPDTVRGIMYALVSAGWLPDTSNKSYGQIQRLLNELRKRGVIPFDWIVDNIRSTNKPSSWTGLQDFAETVAEAYRRDFWASLPEYVCVIVEKDTVAGRIEKTTRAYDVALHALRGFSSTSFAYEIGRQWADIEKPITVYYVGDHDPSGREIETSLVSVLEEYSGGREFAWHRLAVNPEDFNEHNIIPLKVKRSDTRARSFINRYGTNCAEVEAIPADVLRERVADAIESHIPVKRWQGLQAIEEKEKKIWRDVIGKMQGVA